MIFKNNNFIRSFDNQIVFENSKTAKFQKDTLFFAHLTTSYLWISEDVSQLFSPITVKYFQKNIKRHFDFLKETDMKVYILLTSDGPELRFKNFINGDNALVPYKHRNKDSLNELSIEFNNWVMAFNKLMKGLYNNHNYFLDFYEQLKRTKVKEKIMIADFSMDKLGTGFRMSSLFKADENLSKYFLKELKTHIIENNTLSPTRHGKTLYRLEYSFDKLGNGKLIQKGKKHTLSKMDGLTTCLSIIEDKINRIHRDYSVAFNQNKIREMTLVNFAAVKIGEEDWGITYIPNDYQRNQFDKTLLNDENFCKMVFETIFENVLPENYQIGDKLIGHAITDNVRIWGTYVY